MAAFPEAAGCIRIMKTAIITAGGAGMFCGSCMQDNSLARALRMAGTDTVLLPTYTPIRVDETDVSSSRVFLGGINVYLDSMLPGWKFLPRSMKRWLDRPGIVRGLSRFSGSTNAASLGGLTIDLLRGSVGPQKAEIRELIDYLCHDLQPDFILFSNALLSGIVPELRKRFHGRLGCLLQGDDIFLEGLKEPWKKRAMEILRQNVEKFDILLTHSHYYADFMTGYLNLPVEKFRQIPLTIDDVPDPSLIRKLETTASDVTPRDITVGYFARICPEKGAFRFLNAAESVLPRRADLRIAMGGYLPEIHRREFLERAAALKTAFGDRFTWLGSPDNRIEKFHALAGFDWLCVPTEYREPKGIYVLEAALLGIPSLVPAHGAFPELIEELNAGRLYDPAKPDVLEDTLTLLQHPVHTIAAADLRDRCLKRHGLTETGHRVRQVLEQV